MRNDNEDDLRQCIDLIRRYQSVWRWLITLKYPLTIVPRCPMDWYHRSLEACWQSWISEVGWDDDVVSANQAAWYVRAVEKRENGDSWIHVLMSDIENFEYLFRRRWREISGGSGWNRPLNDGIERLFAYFAYKRGCELLVCIADDVAAYWPGRRPSD